MTTRKVIVVEKDCIFCESLLSALAKKGKQVEVVNASTPEGSRWADDHNVDAVPRCLVIVYDEGGKEQVRRCTDQELAELLEG